MSTAKAPARQQQTQQKPAQQPEASPLDQAIVQTEKRTKLITDAAEVLGVAPGQLLGWLRQVWTVSKNESPLTDAELFTGISMIARYELDPVAREIYVTRLKDGRLATIVGIDGWVKILDRTDHYDGQEVIWGPEKDGEVQWIETVIHSTKRKFPTVYRAIRKEYAAIAGFMYPKIPTHMLRIFSLRHAARLFTPLSGDVMTEEEANFINQQFEQPTKNQPVKHEDLNQLKQHIDASFSPPPAQPATAPEPQQEPKEQPKEEPKPEPKQEPQEKPSETIKKYAERTAEPEQAPEQQATPKPSGDILDDLEKCKKLTDVKDVKFKWKGHLEDSWLEQACGAREKQLRDAMNKSAPPKGLLDDK